MLSDPAVLTVTGWQPSSPILQLPDTLSMFQITAVLSHQLAMAVITCMSQSRRGSKTPQAEQASVEGIEVKEMTHHDHHDHRECHLPHDAAEPDCECALEEELEEMDAWTKTMVAIRVLTAFKRRRKKRLEEEKEKAKKERRKSLWKRLGFKLRVFNMFATKISSEDPAKERLIKLKRKLGRHQLFHLLFM